MDDLIIRNKILKDLSISIIEGNEVEAINSAKEVVKNNINIQMVMDTICNKCMKRLGHMYEDRMIFVPELLLSAHAANSTIEYLRYYHSQYKTQKKGCVVLGVVSGDFHDIGKNIVKMMLDLSGYDVHDIGTNNSAEDFLEKANEVSAEIVGVSALMTTSRDNMIDIVNLFLEKRDNTKVIVGGAPVNQEYADEIGAQGYAEDAIMALELVEFLMNDEKRVCNKRKAKLSSYERVIRTIEHQTPDIVPTAPPFQGYWALNEAHMNVYDSIKNPISAANKQYKVVRSCGFDMYECFWDWLASVEAIGGKVMIEPKGNPVTVEPLIKDPSDLDYLEIPDLLENDRIVSGLKTAKKLMEKDGGKRFLYGSLAMPFTLAAEIRGTQNLLMDIYCNRSFVFKLLDFLTDLKIECTKLLIEEGIEGVIYSDPVSSGDLISPDVFEEFAFPYIKRVFKENRKDLIMSGIHICGNINDRLELFNGLDTDIISIDSNVDLYDARERLNNEYVIMGNISPLETLYLSKPINVRLEARSEINRMGSNNFILASGCDITVGTPIQNIKTLTATPKEFCKK